MLYMIVMVGVYDHGSGGIFTSRELAEAHARALADDSDGYHDFRIEEIPVDTPLYPEPRWDYSGRRVSEARIGFVPFTERDNWSWP